MFVADKLRNELIKLITEQGYERIRYSVFSGLKDPRKDDGLWRKLEDMEKEGTKETFKICVIPVTDCDFLSMGIVGDGGEDMEYLMGRTHTLI